MPNRVVRENILTSEPVDLLGWQAEVFYRRLMSKVDDYGRYDARPSILRALLFPLRIDRVREADCTRWLAECQAAGLIVLYGPADKPLLEMLKTDWLKRSPSKYAAPPLQTSANICAQPVASAGLVVDVGVVVEDQKHVRQAERFPEFWKAFPSRKGTSKPNKKGCLAKWKVRGLDSLADAILADVALRRQADSRWKEGFPPDPETYLNQDRWADDKPEALPAIAPAAGNSPAKQETAESKAQAAADFARYVQELGYTP